MKILETTLYLVLVLLLFTVGILGSFFPKKVRDFYVYLITTKSSWFFNAKRSLDLTQKKWYIINLRICGTAAIVIALIGICIIVSKIK
jgi:hypothetical protein